MTGVVFDLDGTLIDSLPDIAAAMDRALGDLGMPLRTREEYERFIGDGARMLVRRAIGEANAHREDEALARFVARYGERLVVHTRPYAGIEALLDALAERRIATSVLSNKPHDWTQEIVRTIFARHPFAAVIGHRAGMPHKPDPSSALEIAAILGQERLLFVGDTAVDIETARRAGMIAIAVAWGMRPREELAGADHVIESPLDLLALL